MQLDFCGLIAWVSHKLFLEAIFRTRSMLCAVGQLPPHPNLLCRENASAIVQHSEDPSLWFLHSIESLCMHAVSAGIFLDHQSVSTRHAQICE